MMVGNVTPSAMVAIFDVSPPNQRISSGNARCSGSKKQGQHQRQADGTRQRPDRDPIPSEARHGADQPATGDARERHADAEHPARDQLAKCVDDRGGPAEDRRDPALAHAVPQRDQGHETNSATPRRGTATAAAGAPRMARAPGARRAQSASPSTTSSLWPVALAIGPPGARAVASSPGRRRGPPRPAGSRSARCRAAGRDGATGSRRGRRAAALLRGCA